MPLLRKDFKCDHCLALVLAEHIGCVEGNLDLPAGQLDQR